MRITTRRVAFSMLLCCFMLVFGTEAEAATWNRDTTYKMEKSGVTYKAYLSKNKKEAWIYNIELPEKHPAETLSFPNKIKGAVVTRIGDPAEDDKDEEGSYRICTDRWDLNKNRKGAKGVKKIILPDTIEDITAECFSDFYDLETINIPAKTKELKRLVFYGCTNLVNVKFKDGKYKIHKYAFGSYEEDTTSCEEYDGVEEFRNLAGHETVYSKNGVLLSEDKKEALWVSGNRSTIIIPKGVKVIKEKAAMGCEAGKVLIPASVTSIENNAFTMKHTVRFTIAKDNKRYAVKDKCVYSKKSKRLVVGVVKKGTLTIPDTVKVLSANSSLVGEEVKKLTIPKSVKKLEQGWFDTGNYGSVGTKIYFKASAPPNSGEDIVPMNTKIYVPKKSIEQYKRWVKKDSEAAKYCKVRGY